MRKNALLFDMLETKKEEEENNNLVSLIPEYQNYKEKFDELKKIVDELNKKIKEVMLKEDLTEYTVDNIKVTCNVSERVSFIEDALIEKLKLLNVSELIKQKEYVDMKELEDAIYNDKVDAAELACCQQKKEVITLRVTKQKTRLNSI